jgi:lipoprotein
MKTLILFLILWISVSCGNKNETNHTGQSIQHSDTLEYRNHTDTNFLTVFLNIEFSGTVAVYDIPHGKIIKYVQNDIEEEDFVMFDLLQKQDSMYYVIAYSGLTNRILAKGWISKNNHLDIYFSAYDSDLIVYKNANDRGVKMFSDKEHLFNDIEVLDFENNWLKIKFNYKGRSYNGWLPPEMQCANPYTTCS